MNELVKEIGEFDGKSLLNLYYSLEKKLVWAENDLQGKQCCIQTRKGMPPFLDGTGSNSLANIKDFNVLNELFVDTIWEEHLNKYNMYRTRFLWINPKSCYSIHVDFTPRIHFVLKTNPKAMFYLPDLGANCMVHLQQGKIYWVDTRKSHSFINFGDTQRLHLVGVVDHNMSY